MRHSKYNCTSSGQEGLAAIKGFFSGRDQVGEERQGLDLRVTDQPTHVVGDQACCLRHLRSDLLVCAIRFCTSDEHHSRG